LWDFHIVELYTPYRRHGSFWKLVSRIRDMTFILFNVDIKVGYRFRRRSSVAMSVEKRKCGIIFIEASKTGWNFPYRTKWIIDSIAHETVHETVEVHAGVHAFDKLDDLPDQLWVS